MSVIFSLLFLVMADPNTVGYMYTWHETAGEPTQEMQESLALQQWEDDYVPWWYQLKYPGVAPNMWFRWERIVLPTAIEWLKTPRDLNGDGEANLPDYGIIAEYHPGGLKSKPPPFIPPPSSPTRLEVIAMFIEELFMTTE